MPTSYAPTHVGIPYNPAGTTHKRLADVYYPATPAPVGGYPALFYFNCVGLTLSSRPGVASVDDGHDLLRYYALEAGWALVDVEVTVQDVGGPPTGGGLYRDPTGGAPYSLNGDGDECYNSDARNVVQFFRSQAALYGLNPYRFAGAGNSAGALCAMAAAFEVDGADPSNTLAMRRASTRLQALVDLKISGWLPGVVQDSAVGGALDTGNPILCKASNPAQLAVDGDDAVDSDALHLSPHWIMLQEGSVGLNRRLPVYCWVNTPPEGGSGKEPIEPPALNYDLDADLLPAYLGDSLGGIVDRHAGWGGIMRIKALRALDSWHNTHSKLVGTADFTVGGMTPDEIISDQHEAAQDQAAWLNEVVPFRAPSEGMSTGSRTVGATWLECASLGAVYPLDGKGGTTDVLAECIIPEGANVVIEQINLESVAGEDPSVTLVDAGGTPFLEMHFAAQSTGRAVPIINMQRGVLNYGAAADFASSAVSAVVLANTMPYVNNPRGGSSGRSTPDATITLVNDDMGQEVVMFDTTNVIAQRYAGGENVDHRVAWELNEIISGAGTADEVIQRTIATVTMAAGTATVTTAAISSIVDVAKCVVFPCSVRNDRNAAGYDSVDATAVLNGDKTITVTRGDSSGEWKGVLCVREYTGANWTVRSWSHTFTSPGGGRQAVTLSGAIPDFAHAFIVGHFRCPTTETANDESGCIFLPPLSGTTTIDVGILSGADNLAGGNYRANGWVVYNPGISVFHGNSFDAAGAGGYAQLTFGAAVQTVDLTIPACNLAESFILSSQVTGGAAAAFPRCNAHFRLKDATTVEGWRGSTGASMQVVTFAIQVIDTTAQGLEYPESPAVGTFKLGKDGMSGGLQGPFGAFVNALGTVVKIYYRLLG